MMTMNNIAEKLIELLDNFPYELSDYVGDNKYVVVDNHIELSKYLVSNDVTIQKHGEWIWHEDEFEYECSACRCHFDYNHTFGIFDHGYEYGSYCPNCGAKMEAQYDF